ncbi:hypothetical protein IV203_030117 [Nitzschia inconspicua]|uniref:Uncharacterized protein n=1 Tax=Nitzschia inconspicua TaxID=303405 RepID=A0A9K3LUS3_9STRA|nr:hypothetical protein IV203_030117 [Nitzschia inconspicua]
MRMTSEMCGKSIEQAWYRLFNAVVQRSSYSQSNGNEMEYRIEKLESTAIAIAGMALTVAGDLLVPVWTGDGDGVHDSQPQRGMPLDVSRLKSMGTPVVSMELQPRLGCRHRRAASSKSSIKVDAVSG